MTVWTVVVVGRENGVYIFASEDDADWFADAAIDNGERVCVLERTVCDAHEAALLVEAESE